MGISVLELWGMWSQHFVNRSTYLFSFFFSSRDRNWHVVCKYNSHLAFSKSDLLVSKMAQPWSSTNTATPWKNSRFIFFMQSDFHVVDKLLIAVNNFLIRMLTLCSVKILLPCYINCFLILKSCHSMRSYDLDQNTLTLFYLSSRRANVLFGLLQVLKLRISMSKNIWTKHLIIRVVCITIVSTEYFSLFAFFFFFTMGPFSFIRSADVFSSQSTQMVNENGTNLSPCKTSATMTKTSGLALVKQTIAFMRL